MLANVRQTFNTLLLRPCRRGWLSVDRESSRRIYGWQCEVAGVLAGPGDRGSGDGMTTSTVENPGGHHGRPVGVAELRLKFAQLVGTSARTCGGLGSPGCSTSWTVPTSSWARPDGDDKDPRRITTSVAAATAASAHPPPARGCSQGLPGRPVTASRLGERLRLLSIRALPARRATLVQLAAEVPAAVLAELLNLTPGTANPMDPRRRRRLVSLRRRTGPQR